MNKLLFKLVIFLPIVCFFLFPGQTAFATSYWAPVTVNVTSPGGTPIANVKLNFDTSSTATYNGDSQLRQCTSEAFVQKISSGYQYLKNLTFTTGANGEVTWDGRTDYGFACSCDDMRVVINLPEGYVVAGLYGDNNNSLTYYVGTTPGGTASTFVHTINDVRSTIYWRVKPQPVPPTNTPVPPTNTPAPPSCNSPCIGPQDCANRNGCPYCDTSTNTCVASPPVTSPPAACGSTCSTPADCVSVRDGCTACTGGKCSQPFNPASCTCDGITYSALFSGQTVVITSFSKIVGADINNAKVVSEKFHLAEGDNAGGKIIAESDYIPSKLIENSSSIVRYQTQWQFKLPQLDTGATYRLWSDINCQPKTIVMNYGFLPKMAVLGSKIKTSSSNNFFSFFDNFLNLFRSSSIKDTVLKILVNPINLSGKKTIQLESIRPATTTEKGCSTIIFRQD